MAYIDFNDEKIPLGKRKVAYIKHLMHKYNYPLLSAQKAANKRFGFEVKYPNVVFVYADYGRMHQFSFRFSEIAEGYEDITKRAGNIEYRQVSLIDGEESERVCAEYKKKGYYVVKVPLYG